MRYTPYFAYGSNMNKAQFASRCPFSFTVGRAVLLGWRLIFTKQGYASIERPEVDPQDPLPITHEVCGTLSLLSDFDEMELDRREGFYVGNYDRRIVMVQVANGNLIPALAYIATEHKLGRPYPDYLAKVIQGALDNELPQAYIHKMMEWADFKPKKHRHEFRFPSQA